LSTTADTEIFLLADPSPALRRRVLTELLEVPEDDGEVSDLTDRLESHGQIAELLAVESRGLRDLSFQLCRLAYAGLTRKHPRVEELAERLLDAQQDDGSFPLEAFVGRDSVYDMIPLQTSLPLRGLAAVGYARDPRVESGYEWLLAQRLDDGAWPMGEAAGQRGYIAGYRRLPGSPGCRANTTGALAALAPHPELAGSEAAHRALDLLLQRETRDEATIGWEVGRLVGVEAPTGFVTFYARFDLAFLLELATHCGASADDPRVTGLVEFLLDRRNANGLWEHPVHPELGRWLTFDLLLSLRRLAGGDWVGLAPQVPFRAYRQTPRRY
jgi:hypothetical protein